MAKKKGQTKDKVRRRMAQKRARSARKKRSKSASADVPFDRLPVETCRLNANWRTLGMAFVLVARRAAEGRIRAACFYIDVWGVGVKDCFMLPFESLSESLDWLRQMEAKLGGVFEECSPELAGELIWGGIEYGREAGFRPPREFRRCRKLVPQVSLDGWNPELFGKDGERLVIGDQEDLKRRSLGDYDPDRTDGHFIIGSDDPPEEW